MFIPYRPDIYVTRWPVFTVVVMVLSTAIYMAQRSSWSALEEHASDFCTDEISRDIEYPGKHYFGDRASCEQVLLYLYSEKDSKLLKEYHDAIVAKNDNYRAEQLLAQYHAFAASAPSDLTSSLVYYRSSWNPITMLTSSVSHASWDHLIGNLFFFFAFAMVVEVIIGPILFFIVFVSMSLGIGVIDSLANIGQEDIPTLGLSGIVFGMLTLALYFAPRVKIKFFYWIIILVGSVSIPLWMVSIWYVGWNIYDYLVIGVVSGTNYIAHLGGAAVGLIMGVTLFREKRHWAQGLLPDKRHNERHQERFKEPDQSLLAMASRATSIPVFMAAGFIFLIVLMSMIGLFIKTFPLQLLLSLPVLLLVYLLYRMKQADRPVWNKYQSATKYLKEQNYRMALEKLEPLAESGYPRAQYQLGRLYASGKGVIRDVMQAGYWYELAAHRGNEHAQNELASLYIDGSGVDQDMDAAMNWLRLASEKLPQAALRLGYYSEHHPDNNKRNLKEAVDAYGQAGQLFMSAKMIKDAESVLLTLEQLAPGHEITVNLGNRIMEYKSLPITRR